MLRNMLFGVMMISGLRVGCNIWRRSKWNIWPGVDGTQTWILWLAHKLQVAFEPCAGMFGALAFVAMRKIQGQAAQTPPLGFTRCNELVNDHLGAVGEVTELAFPDDQGVR